MFGSEDSAVGIVIEDCELGTPKEDDLRFGREQHAHGAAKALWPRVHWPKWRLQPIHGAHARAHFAATLEESQARGGFRRAMRHRSHYCPAM
jgi:hypothetical protein